MDQFDQRNGRKWVNLTNKLVKNGSLLSTKWSKMCQFDQQKWSKICQFDQENGQKYSN